MGYLTSKRHVAVLPILCAIPAFVLSFLCIFAGSKKGFMEDYNIVTLNTSSLGHILINTTSTTTSTSSSATPTATGILSGWLGTIQNETDTIESDLDSIEAALEAELDAELTDMEGDLADALAQDLGIDQWYSLHLMDMCYGYYSPNATASGATKNISSCTAATAMYHFDPADMINSQLSVGPFSLNLSSIGLPQSFQDNINKLDTLLDTTFILYVLSIVFSGLSLLHSLYSLFIPPSQHTSFLRLTNLGLGSTTFTLLFMASILITVGGKKMADEANQNANDVGLYAYRGTKFLGLTWPATVLMAVNAGVWAREWWAVRRQRKRETKMKLESAEMVLSENAGRGGRGGAPPPGYEGLDDDGYRGNGGVANERW